MFVRFLFVSFVFAFCLPLFSQSEELGHGTSRASGSLGTSSIGNFVEFQFRPKTRDLLNQDKGYVPNSESQVMNGAVRYYQDSKHLELTRLNVFRMFSLNPYNSVSKAKSYGFDLGAESITVKTLSSWEGFIFDSPKKEYHRITPIHGEAMAGYTFQTGSEKGNSPLLISLLAGVKSQLHPEFKHNFRLGPEAVLNILYEIGEFKFQFYYAYHYYQWLQNPNDFTANFKLRYSVSVNQEVRVEFLQHKIYQETLLSYHYLF